MAQVARFLLSREFPHHRGDFSVWGPLDPFTAITILRCSRRLHTRSESEDARKWEICPTMMIKCLTLMALPPHASLCQQVVCYKVFRAPRFSRPIAQR